MDDEMTKEQIKEYVDEIADRFASGLSRGSYFMLEGGGGRISRTGTPLGARQTWLSRACME
jgi:hypothetical protein